LVCKSSNRPANSNPSIWIETLSRTTFAQPQDFAPSHLSH
jgi:hypothetical protein